MHPDFNRLKVFYYIYREKSVAAAAKRLHVTQSAVSQHLQKLESELKVQLFTRLHKRLVPTLAGEKLFQVLRPFIDDLSDVVRQIHEARKGPSGMLRMGAPVEFGEKYLPGVCGSFRLSYPDVNFHLELGHPSILLPLVAEGRLDFAFADIFSDRTTFSKELAIFNIQTVAVEELIMAGSRAYYDEYVHGVHSPENLLKCDFIAYQQHAPAVKSWFRHHFNKTAAHLNTTLTVESVRAVITGMKMGLGLGLVPSHSIRAELAARTLVQINTGKREMINRISLVQLRNKVPGLSEKLFLRHFMQEMQEVMPGSTLHAARHG